MSFVRGCAAPGMPSLPAGGLNVLLNRAKTACHAAGTSTGLSCHSCLNLCTNLFERTVTSSLITFPDPAAAPSPRPASRIIVAIHCRSVCAPTPPLAPSPPVASTSMLAFPPPLSPTPLLSRILFSIALSPSILPALTLPPNALRPRPPPPGFRPDCAISRNSEVRTPKVTVVLEFRPLVPAERKQKEKEN